MNKDEKLATRDPQLATGHSQPATPLHTIRLRHPWQCESAGDTIVWSRKFNWPAELPDGELVQLVIENSSPTVTVTLNETALAFDRATSSEITNLLSTHNRLAISSPADENQSAEQCPYQVRLEVVAAC